MEDAVWIVLWIWLLVDGTNTEVGGSDQFPWLFSKVQAAARSAFDPGSSF